MEPEPGPKPKRWYIATGSKVHPCNPHLDAIRASHGAERLPFNYSGAEFDLKWVKRIEKVDWATFDGQKQLVNWVRGSSMLTEKADLARSLRRYGQRSLVDVNFHPRTYILADGNERHLLLATLDAESQTAQGAGHLLIMKPGRNGSQGRGIEVHSAVTMAEMLRDMRVETMRHTVEGEQVKTMRLPDDFIVQEYVDRPLLIEGRKFDLRCYACIFTTQPSLHVVYWPRSGYVRQAMADYTSSNLADRTAHLTNVKVMRDTADFDMQAERAIWDFERLQAFLTAEQLAPPDYVGEDLKGQMRDIMTHAFLSIESEVSKERGQFQLLGFDLLVDTELKLHLIEVNYNPSLSTHTSVLKQVIPPVLKEVIGMALEVHTQQASHDEKGGEGFSLLPLATQVVAETLLPLSARTDEVATEEAETAS